MIGATTPATAADPPQDSEAPRAWIVVDAGSGRVLAAENAHEALEPAGLAKVMTALVAVERLPEDAEVRVSDLAASQPASKLGVTPGEEFGLDDTIAALMLDSANDMSYALAETVGGDLAGFDELLDATADRYGMTDADLGDPAGLSGDDAFDGGPTMSVFDVAVMVRNAQRALPVAKWAGVRTHEFDGASARYELANHNEMLSGGDLETAGVNGFKTAGQGLDGGGLAVTATRGNRNIIAVVLGADDVYAWASYLLELGFETDPTDGTDEVLPPVAVSVRATRERDRDEFLALVTGQPLGTLTATTEAGTEVTPFSTASTITPPTAIESLDGEPVAADPSDETNDGGGGGSFTTVLLLFVVVAVTAIVARREQIKRRRRARERLRRERAALMRRGSLPVVDGRYRTGTRTGNPPQAHVRLRRIDAPPEEDWEDWSGWDDEPPR